jgi:hypothetical protein
MRVLLIHDEMLVITYFTWCFAFHERLSLFTRSIDWHPADGTSLGFPVPHWVSMLEDALGHVWIR